MLFFQAVLLLGYLYAHWLHEKLPSRKQAWLHIAVLAASLAALPIMPSAGVEDSRGRKSVAAHSGAAGGTVGAALFPALVHQPAVAGLVRARSTAAACRTACSRSRMLAPCWRCSAIRCWSNRNLPTRLQAIAWSAGYAVFAACCAASRRGDRRGSRPPRASRRRRRRPRRAARLRATASVAGALPRCASVLLLAVTTHLTQNIAAIPFLWILPLSVYLLSFIVCFEAPRCVPAHRLPAAGGRRAGFMAYELWPYHQEHADRRARSRLFCARRCSSAAWCATANWCAPSRIRAI